MIDTKPKITPAVQRLIDMDDDMICATDLAPIMHMNPRVIIRYAKTGQWDQDAWGNFIISGEGKNAHVKFFRLDFLQKCGFVEKKKSTNEQILERLAALNEGVEMICQILAIMMSDQQRMELTDLIRQKEAEKCATGER